MRYPQHHRAIVFDMDGVLLLSTAAHRTAFEKVLENYRIRFEYSDYAGMRTAEALQAILTQNQTAVSSTELQVLARRKSAIALQSLKECNPIAPNARRTLERLSSRFPLALATSASDATVSWFLDANELRPLFQSVITGSMVATPKPAPEVYIASASSLNLSPTQCLVVEDAVSGIRAAKAARATACAVTGTCPQGTLLQAGADFVIQDLEELLSL